MSGTDLSGRPTVQEFRGYSSSGRAVALQAIGGRFESCYLHQMFLTIRFFSAILIIFFEQRGPGFDSQPGVGLPVWCSGSTIKVEPVMGGWQSDDALDCKPGMR